MATSYLRKTNVRLSLLRGLSSSFQTVTVRNIFEFLEENLVIREPGNGRHPIAYEVSWSIHPIKQRS